MKYAQNGVLRVEAGNPRVVLILFLALNALGYDRENNPMGMTDVRKAVRGLIQGHDWKKKYPELERTFVTNHPWQLLNALFAHPNKFEASEFNNLRQNLKRFSEEPVTKKLLADLEARQARETKELLPLLKREINHLIAFIGKTPQGLKRIVFISNPLDAYWSGYAFGERVGFWSGAKGTGYVVAGPGARKNQGELIRHELLHLLIPDIQIPQRFINTKQSKNLAAQGYTDPRSLNNEYLVRSIDLLYESLVLKKDISKAIQSEEKDFPHIKEVLGLIETDIRTDRP